MVVCYHFGLEPSADFPISASIVCGMVAQIIGHGAQKLGLFVDGACSGADLANDPKEPTKYIGIACSWASDLLPGAGRFLGIGCAAAPSIGHGLGTIWESRHEFDVAEDVVRHNKCIKFSPTHFGSPWLAIDCPKNDRGFSSLPNAISSPAVQPGSGVGGAPIGGWSTAPPEPESGDFLKGAAAVAAGNDHTCALLATGEVACWGWAVHRQLGSAASPTDCNDGCQPTPVMVPNIVAATAISAAGNFSCALIGDGEVECWGENLFGQLGNGTLYDSFPTPVDGIETAVAISTADYHACALLENSTVKCWGLNSAGQLGDGTFGGPEACGPGHISCSTVPVEVQGLTNATAIAAGGQYGAEHTCAVRSDKHVLCWGGNGVGQLGSGMSDGPEECNPPFEFCSTTPTATSGLTDVLGLSAGEFDTCALASAGSVHCWGLNSGGQLGVGTDSGPEQCKPNGNYCSTVPVTVTGLSHATFIVSGGEHNCALLEGGPVRCWGSNRWGNLGTGSTVGPDRCEVLRQACSTEPVEVAGIADATYIDAGGGYQDGAEHTCAVVAGGGVKCWGSNRSGQLGTGAVDGPDSCSEGEYPGPCSAVPLRTRGVQ